MIEFKDYHDLLGHFIIPFSLLLGPVMTMIGLYLLQRSDIHGKNNYITAYIGVILEFAALLAFAYYIFNDYDNIRAIIYDDNGELTSKFLLVQILLIAGIAISAAGVSILNNSGAMPGYGGRMFFIAFLTAVMGLLLFIFFMWLATTIKMPEFDYPYDSGAFDNAMNSYYDKIRLCSFLTSIGFYTIVISAGMTLAGGLFLRHSKVDSATVEIDGNTGINIF